MSNYNITLTAATRQNLLSLQDTAALASTNQTRLSTGKKVNSALDNPTNFFTSQSLTSRASDMNALLDGISNGVQTIQAANQGITSIQKLVDSAKSIASQALASKNTTTVGTATTAGTFPPASDAAISFTVDGVTKTTTLKAAVAGPPAVAGDDIDASIAKLNTAAGSTIFGKSGTKITINAAANVVLDSASKTSLGFTGTTDINIEDKTRTSLANQFNSLLTQIDQQAKDSSYNGVNLISSSAATNKLHVSFNEQGSSGLDVQGSDLTSSGLSLSAIDVTTSTAKFQSDTDVNTTINSLTAASGTLRAQSSTFGSNLTVVQNRQDFSKNLINILQTGSDNLTNADMNAEAANSQALSTRQSLGISALSLANTAQQGILQLLR